VPNPMAPDPTAADTAAPVRRYLEALATRDWAALRETLHDDVVRVGPWHDTYRGADAYVRFLAEVIADLVDYHLEVTRVASTPYGAVVELNETVTLDGVPTRTDEAVVFEVSDSLISSVSVYLQTAPRGS
jgi:ketosteroid isomerase-like protein